jgi:tRNA (guanine-N7-)-methyltransferase
MPGDRPTDNPPDKQPGKPQWYGRRFGHKLRPNRQHLIDTLLPRLAIGLPSHGMLDPAGLFAHAPKDLTLEIGFGGGEHLSAMAAAAPEAGFIGCEPFVNGIASLLADVDADNLQNIRVFSEDARQLLPHLPDACLSRIFLLFPDPWPKKRHNRRRFVQPDTLSDLARVAAPEAEFLFASDHMDYVAWTLAAVHRHPDWTWTGERAQDWRVPPLDWTPTRYEMKARAAGITPAFLLFRRAAKVG